VMVIFASGACREGLGRNYYRAGQDSVTEAMAPAAPEGSPPRRASDCIALTPSCPAVIREGS